MEKSIEPGKEALIYEPSKVSWATAEVIGRAPARWSRATLYLSIFVLLAALGYAHFAEVAITVTGRGMIRTSEKLRPIRAATTGRVKDLAVANGKRVAKGDVLVEMEDLLEPAEAERAKKLLERITKALASVESRSAVSEFGVLTGEPLRLSGPVLMNERSALSQALGGLFQALKTMHEVTPELVRADASELELTASKIKRIKEQHLEKELSSELAELERVSAQLQVAVRDRRESARRQVATAKTAVEVQAHAFAQGLESQTSNLRISAPIDGVVSGLAVAGNGELIQAGQTLFQLIPDGGRLVAEVEIANKDIAGLVVGMPVALKLDAFPYQDYGTVPGKLAELPDDVLPAADGGGAAYVVRIDLGRFEVDESGAKKPIKLGMTLSADVEVRRRTLLELAILEVLKLTSVF